MYAALRPGRAFVAFASLSLLACGDAPQPSTPKPAPLTAPTVEVPATPATTAPASAEKARPLRAFCNEQQREEAKAIIGQLDNAQSILDSQPPANGGAYMTTQLVNLLHMPCFALTSALDPFDSNLAARSWWDRGGKRWLENNASYQADRDQTYIVVPSVLPTLASDVGDGAKSPLAPLLCPVASAMADMQPAAPVSAAAACGRETSGWMLRAKQAFEGIAAAYHTTSLEQAPYLRSRQECEKLALEERKEARFVQYAKCLDALAPEVDAYPLGRFQPPSEGWMIVRGRRATHNGCDEIRAYDLGSGAAYIARDCGSKGATTEVGRMPVDATREALLTALLAPTAQHYVTAEAVSFKLPKDIPAIADGPNQGTGRGGGIDNVTSLEIAWVRKGAGQARVTLTWPRAFYPAHQHAVRLLDIAERAFVPAKCGAARLPNFTWDALGPHVEKHEQRDHTSSPALLRSFESLRASACPGAK